MLELVIMELSIPYQKEIKDDDFDNKQKIKRTKFTTPPQPLYKNTTCGHLLTKLQISKTQHSHLHQRIHPMFHVLILQIQKIQLRQKSHIILII